MEKLARSLAVLALMETLAVPPCPAAKEPPWFVGNPPPCTSR
jgi:hypothetical protein